MIGTAVLLALFQRVHPSTVLSQVSRVDPLRLTLAAFFVALSYVCRALLWKRLLENEHAYPYGPVFRSTMIGYLVNNLVPARVGDVTRGLWLSKSCGGSKTAILGSLALERLLDVVIITVVLVASTLALGLRESWLLPSALYLVAAVILIFALTMGLKWLSTASGVRLTENFIQASRMSSLHGADISRHTRILSDLGSAITVGSAGRGLPTLVVTWFVTYWGLYFTLDSLGLATGLGLVPTALILCMSGFGLAIPSLPASIGTYQAAFVFGASIVGIPESRSLSASLVYQALWVSVTSLLGLLCLAWEGKVPFELAQRLRDTPPTRDAAASSPK